MLRLKQKPWLFMRIWCIASLIGCILASGSTLWAQEAATVPNVTGLTIPRAAAVLNHVGLRLGAQTVVPWTPEARQGLNRIDTQSPLAGEAAEPGAPVDLTVFGTPTVSLLYDGNDLTLINLTDAAINTSGLSFTALDGATATFAAARWGDTLPPHTCFQIWSISRNEPKSVDGCGSMQNWVWTGNADEHFWTVSSGATRFAVVNGNIQQAICTAATSGSESQPVRCDFALADESAVQVTPYVYFAYTTEAFVALNNSTDWWMPTTQTTIVNFNPGLSMPGLSLQLGDAALYNSPSSVADIARLAPGQCILFTSDNPDAAPPEPCDVIARLTTTSDIAFWLTGFEVSNSSDSVRRQCPAAELNKITVCILPM